MIAIQKSKEFVKDWDMFSCPSSLRIKGNSNYTTLCGGFCSLILVLSFIGIFATTFINVLLKTNVNSSIQIIQDPNKINSITNLQFALGVDGVDLNGPFRAFSTYIKTGRIQNNSGTVINQQFIDMVPCTADQWKILGVDYTSIFSNYKMEMMICPDPQTQLNISGFRGSSQFDFIQVSILKCQNDTWQEKPCFPQAFIDSIIAQVLTQINYISVNIYIPDTIINPQQEFPATIALNTDSFLTFTNTSGSRGRLKVSPYEIETDQTILPWNQKTTQTGFYIESSEKFTNQIFNQYVMQFTIECTKRVKKIDRSYRKIDDMLSYAGGLFGIIIGLVGFFIGSYSQYCFQLQVSNRYFKHSKDTNVQKFNFFTYIKFRFYQLIKYCCPDISKKMKNIDKAKQQMNQQLDMRLVLQKLNYFYFMSKILLTEQQKTALYLAQPPTIQQHSKIRQAFQESNRLMCELEQQNQIDQPTQDILKQIIQMGIQMGFSKRQIEVTDDLLLSHVKNMQDKDLKGMDETTKRVLTLIGKNVKKLIQKRETFEKSINDENKIYNIYDQNQENNNKVIKENMKTDRKNIFAMLSPDILKIQNLQ